MKLLWLILPAFLMLQARGKKKVLVGTKVVRHTTKEQVVVKTPVVKMVVSKKGGIKAKEGKGPPKDEDLLPRILTPEEYKKSLDEQCYCGIVGTSIKEVVTSLYYTTYRGVVGSDGSLRADQDEGVPAPRRGELGPLRAVCGYAVWVGPTVPTVRSCSPLCSARPHF